MVEDQREKKIDISWQLGFYTGLKGMIPKIVV